MDDKSWTYFVGRTADGAAVYATLTARLVGERITLTDHTEIDGPIEVVSVSWAIADIAETAPQYATDGGREMSEPYFDRRYRGGGQIPASDRVIVDPAIDPDTLAFIEQAWVDHHLNDMHAECDHMRPGVDYDVPDGEGLPPDIYGTARALQSWRLNNVVCAAGTGYRYGRAWLARRVPADVWSRFLELAQGQGR